MYSISEPLTVLKACPSSNLFLITLNKKLSCSGLKNLPTPLFKTYLYWSLFSLPTKVLLFKTVSSFKNGLPLSLNKTVYTGQKIYFVARLKSSDNYGVKNAPKLDFYNNTELYKMNLSCLDEFDQLVESAFVANFDDTENIGGYFKGYFVIDNENTNIRIESKVLTETGLVSGVSNNFSVFNSGGLYNYRKINEDHDQTKYYIDLIFQNILTSKQNFFDNFLGTIVGNLSSNPNTLGIKVYEKISNFVFIIILL